MFKYKCLSLVIILLSLFLTSIATATNSNNDDSTDANMAGLKKCQDILSNDQNKNPFVARIREAAHLLVEKKSQDFETAWEDVRTFLLSLSNDPEVLSHQEKYRVTVAKRLEELTPIKERVLSLKVVHEIVKRANSKAIDKKSSIDRFKADIVKKQLHEAIFGSPFENGDELSAGLIEHLQQISRPKEDLESLYQEIEKLISTPTSKYEELAPLIDRLITTMEFKLDQELPYFFEHSLSSKLGGSFIAQRLILNIFPVAIGKDFKAFGLTFHQFYVLKESYESAKFNIQVVEFSFDKTYQLMEKISLKFDVWEKLIRGFKDKSV